jgi:drug/metabolite transporter (DMT)-like permease
MRTVLLTLSALVAFAANSVLCRLALGGRAIDAASFATIRLASGALALLSLLALVSRGRGDRRDGRGPAPDDERTAGPARRVRPAGSWRSAAALFLYAVPFAFAYLSLSAGTGALILFGAVQATMIAVGLRGGERPHRLEWWGLIIAIAGLIVLVLPGLRAPAPAGSLLMAVAGMAWGVYSLRGRGAGRPLAITAGNFARAAPLALAVSLLCLRALHVSPRGALLAVLSGAVTSGLGYAIWYAALPGLTATRAATVQLAVPVLAALGGVAFLGEHVTLRLVVSATFILGGVAAALRGRLRPVPPGNDGAS